MSNTDRQLSLLKGQIYSEIIKANDSAPVERHITPKSAFTVVQRSLIETKGMPFEVREFRAMRELSAFISLSQENKFSDKYNNHTDLLPIYHPSSTRLHAMTASALRSARLRWILADPSISEEAKPLLASAFSTEPDSLEHKYSITRLEMLPAGSVPLETLTAAFMGDGNSYMARRLRAMKQRRDRNGQFAEEGGGLRNLIRRLNGEIHWLSGRIVGADENSDTVDVEYANGLIGRVPIKKADSFKAYISNGSKDGYSPRVADISSSDLADVMDEKDIQYVDAPAGWSLNKDFPVAKDEKAYSDEHYTVVKKANPDGTFDFRLIDQNNDVVSEGKNWSDMIETSRHDAENNQVPVKKKKSKAKAEAKLPEEEPAKPEEFQYTYPDGAYHLQTTVKHMPGTEPINGSDDYTDDPEELAQKFGKGDGPKALLRALQQALLPKKDGTPANGFGELPFEYEEPVPAEALYQAMEQLGLDAQKYAAKIYDLRLGNNVNEQNLADSRSLAKAEKITPKVSTPEEIKPQQVAKLKEKGNNLPEESTGEINEERATKLNARADELAAAGKPARAAIFRLRGYRDGKGVRLYSSTGAGDVSLPVGDVKAVNSFVPSDSAKNIMQDGGITPITMHELEASPENAVIFHQAITDAKNANEHGASVYVYSPEEYAGMRMFLSDDGKSGFALKGNDLVSVFKGDTTDKRVAHAMVPLAIQEGAKTADAFDTVLPEIYGDHGLKTVARLPWDDSQAPDNWNKEVFSESNNGEPDVVFMAYDPEDVKGYEKGQGQEFSDYGDAVGAQEDATSGEKKAEVEAELPKEETKKTTPTPEEPKATEGVQVEATSPSTVEEKLPARNITPIDSEEDVPVEDTIPDSPVNPEALPTTEGSADEFDFSDEAFPPTDQQLAVLKAVITGKDVVVRALAGTGKTSTLKLIARTLLKKDKNKKIIYVAFNKSIQLEADATMPENVEARTADSLAWRTMPKELTGKKSASNKNIIFKAKDIAAHFGISEMQNPDSKEKDILSPAEVVQIVRRALENYCISADDTISEKHFNLENVPPQLVELANKFWEDIKSPKGVLPFTNSHATKLWALSKPDFSKTGAGLNTPANVIFFDEAQDINPVLAKVIADQNIQKVYVGDENQAIYGFRGAEDELQNVKAKYDLPLTKSWRFGPQVAGMGNRFLALLKSKNRVEGGGPDGEIVSPNTMEDADAILVRSNGGAIQAIIDEIGRGRTVGVSEAYKAELEKLVNTAAWLKYGGQKPYSIHEDLAPYSSWEEVSKAVDKGESAKVTMLYNMVEQNGIKEIKDLLSQVQVVKNKEEAVNAPGEFTPTNVADVAEGKKGSIASGLDYTVEDGKVFISGKGTYAAKDTIKSKGYKWNPDKKQWYKETSSDQERIDAIDGLRKAIGGFEAPPQVDVVVTTAHKAKGLEWDRVRIHSDFWGPKQDKETGKTIMPSDEELRLAYVAVTRAKKVLDPGALAWVYGYTSEDDEKPIATPSVEEGTTPDISETIAEPSAPEVPSANGEPNPEDITQEISSAYPTPEEIQAMMEGEGISEEDNFEGDIPEEVLPKSAAKSIEEKSAPETPIQEIASEEATPSVTGWENELPKPSGDGSSSPRKVTTTVSDLKPGDVLVNDHFTVESVFSDEESEKKKPGSVWVTGYYPSHQSQQTKLWYPSDTREVYRDVISPEKGNLPELSKPNMKSFGKMTKDENGNWILKDPANQASYDAAKAEYDKMLADAMGRWAAPENPREIDLSHSQAKAFKTVVLPHDLKPGDITYMTEDYHTGKFYDEPFTSYFVIESVDTTPDENGKIKVTGYFPGHAVQEKTWNSTTPISIVRNENESNIPTKGEGELHLPKLKTDDKYKDPITGKVTKETRDIWAQDMKDYYDAKKASSSLYSDAAISDYIEGGQFSQPEKNKKTGAKKPRKPDAPAFQGTELPELIRQANGDPVKVKELLNGREIIFFDFETDANSFDPTQTKPIQVAAHKIKDGKIVDSFVAFMNPGATLGDFYYTTDENGNKVLKGDLKNPDGEPVSDEWLAKQQSVEEGMKKFFEWMGENPIVAGHNIAQFDEPILAHQAGMIGADYNPVGILDTLPLARSIITDGSNHKLGTLTERYNVKLDNWHDAEADSMAVKGVLDGLLDEMAEKGVGLDQIDIDAKYAEYEEKLNNYFTQLEAYKASQNPDPMGKVVAEALTNPDAKPNLDEIIKENKVEEAISPEGIVNGPDEQPPANFPTATPSTDSHEWVADDENTTLIDGKIRPDDMQVGDFIPLSDGSGYREIISIEENPEDSNFLVVKTRIVGTTDTKDNNWFRWNKNFEGIRRPNATDDGNAHVQGLMDENADHVYDISNWKQVGEQTGSNQGGLFEDESGNRYYVKFPQSEKHARNEVLASAFYEEAGIKNGRVYLGKDKDGNTVLVSPWIEGSDKDFASKMSDPEVKKNAQLGFVFDAWLNNWDSVGLLYDNMLTVGKDVYRVDPGGALLFRAQGKDKSDSLTPDVTQIDSLRDSSVNPQAGKVFGDMTDKDLADSAHFVEFITPEKINELVDSVFPDDKETADFLKERLLARRDYIINRFKLGQEKPTPSEENVVPEEKTSLESDLKEVNDNEFFKMTDDLNSVGGSDYEYISDWDSLTIMNPSSGQSGYIEKNENGKYSLTYVKEDGSETTPESFDTLQEAVDSAHSTIDKIIEEKAKENLKNQPKIFVNNIDKIQEYLGADWNSETMSSFKIEKKSDSVLDITSADGDTVFTVIADDVDGKYSIFRTDHNAGEQMEHVSDSSSVADAIAKVVEMSQNHLDSKEKEKPEEQKDFFTKAKEMASSLQHNYSDFPTNVYFAADTDTLYASIPTAQVNYNIKHPNDNENKFVLSSNDGLVSKFDTFEDAVNGLHDELTKLKEMYMSGELKNKEPKDYYTAIDEEKYYINNYLDSNLDDLKNNVNISQRPNEITIKSGSKTITAKSTDENEWHITSVDSEDPWDAVTDIGYFDATSAADTLVDIVKSLNNQPVNSSDTPDISDTVNDIFDGVIDESNAPTVDNIVKDQAKISNAEKKITDPNVVLQEIKDAHPDHKVVDNGHIIVSSKTVEYHDGKYTFETRVIRNADETFTVYGVQRNETTGEEKFILYKGGNRRHSYEAISTKINEMNARFAGNDPRYQVSKIKQNVKKSLEDFNFFKSEDIGTTNVSAQETPNTPESIPNFDNFEIQKTGDPLKDTWIAVIENAVKTEGFVNPDLFDKLSVIPGVTPELIDELKSLTDDAVKKVTPASQENKEPKTTEIKKAHISSDGVTAVQVGHTVQYVGNGKHKGKVGIVKKLTEGLSTEKYAYGDYVRVKFPGEEAVTLNASKLTILDAEGNPVTPKAIENPVPNAEPTTPSTPSTPEEPTTPKESSTPDVGENLTKGKQEVFEGNGGDFIQFSKENAIDKKSAKFLEEFGANDYNTFLSSLKESNISVKDSGGTSSGKRLIPGMTVSEPSGETSHGIVMETYPGADGGDKVDVAWLTGPKAGSNERTLSSNVTSSGYFYNEEESKDLFNISINQNKLDKLTEEIKKKEQAKSEVQKKAEEEAKKKKVLEDLAKAEQGLVLGTGAEPVNTPEHVDWSHVEFEGIHTLDEAINRVKNNIVDATNGMDILADSDAIEDNKFTIQKVESTTGEKLIRLRFKLTPWVADKEISSLGSKNGTSSLDLVEFKKKPDGSLVMTGKQHSRLEYIDAAKNGSTFRHDIKDSAGNIIGYALIHRANKDEETPNFKKESQLIAFHNLVEIYLNDDSNSDDISNALKTIGVSSPRPATKQDIKILVENKLLSAFAPKGPIPENYTGETRIKLLQWIEDNYGINANMVTPELNSDGRGISLLLPEKVGKELAKKKEIGEFFHNWSSSNLPPSGDDLADFLFKFITETSLMSTVDRWTNGIPVSGMSSSSDIHGPGGSYVFLKTRKTKAGKHTSSSGFRFNFDAAKLLRRIDFYCNSYDAFGAKSKQNQYEELAAGNYETLFKQSIDWSCLNSLSGVGMSTREKLYERFVEAGITEIGGISIKNMLGIK